jgi:hypothetical protein
VCRGFARDDGFGVHFACDCSIHLVLVLNGRMDFSGL